MDHGSTQSREGRGTAGRGYRTAGFWAAAPELLAACREAIRWFRKAPRPLREQVEAALGEEAPVQTLSEAVRRAGRRPAEPEHACAGCGRVFPRGEPLQPIEHFRERVAAGDILPSGQCPRCGGLCYLAAPPESRATDGQAAGSPARQCAGDGTVLVYHRDGLPDPLQGEAELARGWPDRYRPVARVEADRPEAAYWKTNTTDRPWWEKPGVKVLAEPPLRSTSVGDVVAAGDGPHLCCRIGWRRIDELTGCGE